MHAGHDGRLIHQAAEPRRRTAGRPEPDLRRPRVTCASQELVDNAERSLAVGLGPA
ncbi:MULTISPECIES: hypothetical protein [Streptomyces]|uniref:hypothetical protein n=1 Tax=Streptomyces TaxID=1883 RepID=UPI0016010437|nr:hypothetical protein [Streptomyces murinus]MBA9048935.1 hypothetical protein [Streptomyces murinus]